MWEGGASSTRLATGCALFNGFRFRLAKALPCVTTERTHAACLE
jgi:hypothetical protein